MSSDNQRSDQLHTVATSYVVIADIQSFFDTLGHDWLMKMLEHDIVDKRFLEIIRRFLKTGILENGKIIEAESR